MASFKDRFLSSHRSKVKSSLCGRLNVINSILLFNFLDIIFLVFLWLLNSRAYVDYRCSAFKFELAINTVITFVCFVGIINCTFIIFISISILLHLIRFWHMCHMAGTLVGLISFNMVRLVSTGNEDLWVRYVRMFTIYPASVPIAIIRLLLCVLSLWYCLVLQRIRFSGGDGRDFKSAEELEMESMETEDNAA